MNKRPHIRNTILIYFYGTLFLVFLLLAAGFNWAARQRVVSSLKDQLESAEELALEFAGSTPGPGSGERRQQFRDMMHSTQEEMAVNLLFLNENYELTLELADQSDEAMHEGRGRMHGSPNRSTRAQAEEDLLVVGHAAYVESMVVYDHVKASSYDLSRPAITQASIDGERYYLQSSPFPGAAGEQPEYVLAFAGTSLYDRQLADTMRILVIVMIPILVLTFLIVRYLAGRLARPISQLEGLSSRLGSGDFRGEDFSLREQELADLNTSLNETAKKLKEYDDNQKIFFQNVSHELRTPLTNIRGYAEGIQYGVFDRETGSRVIMDESVRLEKLVDDILFLSRLESGESVEEEAVTISLSELLFGAREQVRPDSGLSDKKIQVLLEQDPRITVYYEELTRAVVNLLDNAIRYAASTVWLEGSVEDGQLRIRVTDDGPGLEPGTEESVFRRFSKGRDGRHGIGLSIVAASVRHHGGTVTAGRRPEGTGARFTITIPLKVADRNQRT